MDSRVKHVPLLTKHVPLHSEQTPIARPASPLFRIHHFIANLKGYSKAPNNCHQH